MPATLTSTAAGRSLPITRLAVGRYIWHDGAFRRVTAVDGRVVRMGSHVLHSFNASTVEVASARQVHDDCRMGVAA